MNIFKKSVSAVVFSMAVLTAANSQIVTVVRKPTGDDYWYTLKLAQDSFDSADYGRVISLAEQAKNKRKAQIEWEQYVLDQAQRSREVRLAGDDLGLVVNAMKRAKLTDAHKIIDSYTSYYGSEKFKGRFSNLLDFIERNKLYPEADYMIGKVYKVEGEIKKAEIYMKKAYESFDLLNVPDSKYDILYDMADIAKSQLDSLNYGQYLSSSRKSGYYADYEKYMTDILADDKLYSNPSFMNSMVKAISANDKKAVGRFFELYRSEIDRSLDALVGLTAYYRTSALYVQSNEDLKKEQTKALKCAALGSVVAVSKIQEILEDRLTDYRYTDLSDLLKKCSRFSDIVDWGNDTGVWELLGILAETASDLGYTSFSRELMNILSQSNPEQYWQDWAMRRVSK